ncbi:MAG TPA: hypothetical protein VE954_19970 [Oligoflexus sp.]|uniref:hypothetical protein n=1 Tax=Oligoflexus sp. TaxID=1971216 RepID=UPI002D2D3718|nr:hypothetical protein [Oligoflexus sp.]HYX35379.1 hypothetical protein [Oligoflexus sp.]
MNFISAGGAIRVVVYDDRPDSPSKGLFGEWELSTQNYQRLTLPPKLWVAFQGVGKAQNLLLNIANIEHNPLESENCELHTFDYEWPNP